MKELEKIYELWSATQSDASDIVQKWSDMEAYLYKNCTDTTREKLKNT